jgi:hypothetical protein
MKKTMGTPLNNSCLMVRTSSMHSTPVRCPDVHEKGYRQEKLAHWGKLGVKSE